MRKDGFSTIGCKQLARRLLARPSGGGGAVGRFLVSSVVALLFTVPAVVADGESSAPPRRGTSPSRLAPASLPPRMSLLLPGLEGARALDFDETLRVVAAGDRGRVLVAWASRYCQGSEATFGLDEMQRHQLARDLGFVDGACGEAADGSSCLHFADNWGTLEGREPTQYAETATKRYYLINGVPYACLWIGRGAVQPVDPGTGRPVSGGSAYVLLWHQADCVTKGLPDVRRVRSRGPSVVCD